MATIEPNPRARLVARVLEAPDDDGEGEGDDCAAPPVVLVPLRVIARSW